MSNEIIYLTAEGMNKLKEEMGKNLAKIVVKGSVDMTEKLKTIGLKSGVYAIRFNNGKSQLVIMK